MQQTGETSVQMRPLVEGDRFRVRRWLAEAHVAQWWGSRAAAEAAMAMAEASHTAVARIIEYEQQSIGYAHVLDLADTSLPPAVWHADVFIGAIPYRGKGLGALALAGLRDELFATTLAQGMAVRVSIRNEAAVRAIERSGFKWHSMVRDAQLGACWWLIAMRP